MEATLTVTGLSEVRQGCDRARRALDAGTNLVLRDLADLFRKGESDVFATQGAALGKRWAPHRPATVKSRGYMIQRFGLQVRPSSPVLVLYGDLRASLAEKGGAQEQAIGQQTVRITVDTGRINRHNRVKGTGMTLNAKGQRRKVRGKAGKRYPEDIIAVHEGTRPMVGTPGYVHFAQGARVRTFIDRVSTVLGDGEPEGSWEGWHD